MPPCLPRPRSVERLAQDRRQLLEGDPVAVDADPVALVDARRQRRVALPQPGVEVGRGAADRRRPAPAPGVDEGDVVLVRRRSCRSRGRCPRTCPARPAGRCRCRSGAPRSSRPDPVNVPHSGAPPYITPSTSATPSSASAASSGVTGSAGGQLGVDPVDQRPRGPAGGRTCRPGCHPTSARPRPRGRPARARWPARGSSRRRRRAARRRTPAAGRRPPRRSRGRRGGRAVPDDLGPEQLHPGEVPEQVGGVPVGAGRHPRARVAVGQRRAEPRGLGANVVEVGRVLESGHGRRR